MPDPAKGISHRKMAAEPEALLGKDVPDQTLLIPYVFKIFTTLDFQVSLAMDDVNTVRIGWSGGAQTVIYPQVRGMHAEA